MDSPGEGVTLWVGWFALLAGSVWSAREIYKLVRGRISRYNPLFMLGVALYLLGVGFKWAIVGPAPIRFYLSDIGTPFAVSYVFFLPIWQWRVKSPHYDTLDWAERWFLRLRLHRVTLIIGFCLAMVCELAAGYAYGTGRVEKELKALGVGRFEWWDVLCYILATAAGLVMLHFWKRQIQQDRPIIEEEYARRATELAEQAAREKTNKRAAQRERRRKRQRRQGGEKRR